MSGFADTITGLCGMLPPCRPWNGGLSGDSHVGAGIHTWTVWHGGEVESGQQAGTSQRQDLGGLL